MTYTNGTRRDEARYERTICQWDTMLVINTSDTSQSQMNARTAPTTQTNGFFNNSLNSQVDGAKHIDTGKRLQY